MKTTKDMNNLFPTNLEEVESANMHPELQEMLEEAENSREKRKALLNLKASINAHQDTFDDLKQALQEYINLL